MFLSGRWHINTLMAEGSWVQVLHLEPQGRCLNDANARRGRKLFRLTLQVRSRSLQVWSPWISCQPEPKPMALPFRAGCTVPF